MDLWIAALQPVLDCDGVSATEMETQQNHAQQTGQVISNWILCCFRDIAQTNLAKGGPVWAVLLQSFAWVKQQCADTWDKMANWVPEILEQHVSAGQVGVFLAALYQLMCTQQQGITSMVVPQARVLVHLGVHSWAAQASLTWLFAQVIPRLGSLAGLGPAAQPGNAQVPQQAAPVGTIQYTPIPPKGGVLIPTGEWPVSQIKHEGTVNQPIFLGNDKHTVRYTATSCLTTVHYAKKGLNGRSKNIDT